MSAASAETGGATDDTPESLSGTQKVSALIRVVTGTQVGSPGRLQGQLTGRRSGPHGYSLLETLH